jgi:hypothetical protein
MEKSYTAPFKYLVESMLLEWDASIKLLPRAIFMAKSWNIKELHSRGSLPALPSNVILGTCTPACSSIELITTVKGCSLQAPRVDLIRYVTVEVPYPGLIFAGKAGAHLSGALTGLTTLSYFLWQRLLVACSCCFCHCLPIRDSTLVDHQPCCKH